MKDMLTKSYPTLIIVFVIAFLLGYGTSARVINRSKSGATQKATESAATAETEKAEETKTAEETAEKAEEAKSDTSALAQISATLGLGINTVSANDQPAGESVSVVVKAEKDVWVAVHEDTGGKPGSILGAQLFTKGTTTGTVDLLRRLMAGRKYYAMLHADNGDRKFDPKKDMPLVGSTGGVIADTFLATDTQITQ